METKELYISPYTEAESILPEWIIASSFNQTEQTERLGWDEFEQDL